MTINAFIRQSLDSIVIKTQNMLAETKKERTKILAVAAQAFKVAVHVATVAAPLTCVAYAFGNQDGSMPLHKPSLPIDPISNPQTEIHLNPTINLPIEPPFQPEKIFPGPDFQVESKEKLIGLSPVKLLLGVTVITFIKFLHDYLYYKPIIPMQK